MFTFNKPIPVFLNVYDLTQKQYLHYVGMGAYHSGVEVGGREYTFAGGAGIFQHDAKDAPGATFRESIEYGTIDSAATLSRAIDTLKHDFGPDKYNILNNNCNHFSRALIKELLHKETPAYLNRLASFGSFFSCFLPKNRLNEAPVNDASHFSNSTSAPNYRAFSGQGQVLSNAPKPDTTTASVSAEASKEEQERIRQARLSRLGGSTDGGRL